MTVLDNNTAALVVVALVLTPAAPRGLRGVEECGLVSV